MDHGLGDVDAFLVIAYETPPSCSPAECSFDDPAPVQDLKTLGAVGSLDDLDREVEESGLVHEFCAVIGAVSEQMPEPGPAFANGIEDHLCPGTVGHIGWREQDHQQPAIGVHRDVALASDDLLACIVTSCFCLRSFDTLAVDDTACRARLATRPLPIKHQRDIVDRPEHETSNKAAEPPIHRLPG